MGKYVADPAAKAAKLAALQEQLEAGVKAVTTSAGFQAWVQSASRFYRYSFRNQLLIAMQAPEATRVAGFNAWKAMGRTVKKGEKGIAILAPNTYAVKDDVTGERVGTKLAGFHIEHVFDVSQTDGEPLPTLELGPVLGDATGLWSTLTTAAHSLGVTRVARPAIGGNSAGHWPTGYEQARGYYVPTERAIFVRADLDDAEAVKTLAHEIAHHVADHQAGDEREEAETVAEGVAAIVLGHFGMDSSAYSYTYIARWAQDAKVLQRNLTVIAAIAKRILTATEPQPEQVAA